MDEQLNNDPLAGLEAYGKKQPKTATCPRCRTLAEIDDPLPENEDPNALLQGHFLSRGGGALIVSSSGTGKSVLTMQAAILWAMGCPCLGIAPTHPLKIGIIESEDDDYRLGRDRNDIHDILVEEGYDPDEVCKALESVYILDMTGKTDEGFVEGLEADFEVNRPDLYFVNPLFAVFGGDICNSGDATHFFRELIDPFIKTNKVGIVFVHHSTKPPASKDSKTWNGNYGEYLGCGSSELTNWARSILTVTKTKSDGVFVLNACKNGYGLGWKDEDNLPTTAKIVAHCSDGRHFWREATAEEMASIKSPKALAKGARKKKQQQQVEDGVRKLVATLQTKPALPASEIRDIARKECKSLGNAVFSELTAKPEKYGVHIMKAKHNNATFIGVGREKVQDAIRYYDFCKLAEQEA